MKLIDDHQGLLLQADIEGIPKVMVMNIKFPHWSLVIQGTWSSGDYRLLDGGACVTHADTNLKVLMVMVVMVEMVEMVVMVVIVVIVMVMRAPVHT